MTSKSAMNRAQWSHMTKKEQREYVSMHGIAIRCSTGLADEHTYGWGDLDANGYWEFPCPWAEEYLPAAGAVTTSEQLTALEEKEWRFFDTWPSPCWRKPNGAIVTTRLDGMWVAQGQPADIMEFASILGNAPQGYKLVPAGPFDAWLQARNDHQKAIMDYDDEKALGLRSVMDKRAAELAAALSTKTEVPHGK